MKRKVIAATLAAMALVGCKEQATESSAQPTAAAVSSAELALESMESRASYAMGMSLGEQLRNQGTELELEAFSAGLGTAMKGEEPALSMADMAIAMQSFQEQQAQRMQAEHEQQAVDNKQASEAFLAENADKEGVVVTESGLQYRVITEGSGEKPNADDVVEVHYRGTLLDGTEFDSSYKRNSSVSFPLNGVIPGWTEALQLMPVGSKWELFIPSDLAYGPGGTGGPIGPNQALIFEVELLAIQSDEQ